METRIAEVGDEIYQLTTHITDMDFCFNQYLIGGDEPTLFHTGGVGLFPLVKDAMAKVLDPSTLRYISFGHVESDESGSMNLWLETAPNATIAVGTTACMVSVNDLAIRPPQVVGNGESFKAGTHSLRWIDTPHTPHGWEAGVLYDESTKTLFCGDLLTRTGSYSPTSSDDPIGPAAAAEDMFHSLSLHPTAPSQIRGLAELDIDRLALMHGPVYDGDCNAALRALAADVEGRIAAAS